MLSKKSTTTATAAPLPPPVAAAASPTQMTCRDYAWFRMCSPGSPMVINVALAVASKKTSKARLTAEGLAAAVSSEGGLLDAFPRFRSSVKRLPARERLRLNPWSWLEHGRRRHWVVEEGFDARGHIRLEEGGEGDAEKEDGERINNGNGDVDKSLSSSLEERLSRLASVPLDRKKPLWEMILLDDDEGSQQVVLFRIHHAVTDGVGLAKILRRLTTDEETRTDENGDETIKATTPTPTKTSKEKKKEKKQPSSLKTLANAARMTFTWPLGHRGPRAFKPPRQSSCPSKKLSWLSPPLDLDRVRAVARGFDFKEAGERKRTATTINDVFVAVVSGALRRYFGFDDKGEEQRDKIRAFVTFSLRDKESSNDDDGGDDDDGNSPSSSPSSFALGNEFGLVAIDLPTDRSSSSSPRQRLLESSRRMQKVKSSHEARASAALLSLAGTAHGRGMQNFSMGKFNSYGVVVLSNVDGNSLGSRRRRLLAGLPLSDVVLFVPQPQNIRAGFGLFSFAGKVQLSLFADKDLIPDPQRMLELARSEFEELEKEVVGRGEE